MGQHGERAFLGEPLEGPAVPGLTGSRCRDQRHLPVFPTGRTGRAAVGLHGDAGAQPEVSLRKRDAMGVLAVDARSRPCHDPYAAGGDRVRQARVQVGVAHDAAELGHPEIGIANDGAAKAPALGHVDCPDGRSLAGPAANGIQHHAATLVERQHARIGRRGVAVEGTAIRLQQHDTAGSRRSAREQQRERGADRAAAQDGDIEFLF